MIKPVLYLIIYGVASLGYFISTAKEYKKLYYDKLVIKKLPMQVIKEDYDTITIRYNNKIFREP